MGLSAENGKVVVESWDVCKSKGKKKKKKQKEGKVVEEEEEEELEGETGCWVRLRFIGSCISSRSKVDSSVSGTSTHDGNLLFPWKSCYFICSYDDVLGSSFFCKCVWLWYVFDCT